MRGHSPIVISEFNGLWKRGDAEATPIDHFRDCQNIQYQQSGFCTRPGMSIFRVGELPGETIRNVVRIYTYVHAGVQSLLVLDTSGNIYHTESPTPTTAILTIADMTDFAFVSVAGRAYISPHNGVTGLEDEFLYVYLGDGAVARKAGGAAPTGSAMGAATSATAGHVEAGYHIFAVVYETDTGFLTQLGPTTFTELNVLTDGFKVDLTGIPVSPSGDVVARRIVASKAIDPLNYTGDLTGYQFFFVPGGRIANNTATTLSVSFFDSELLSDASHLLDLFADIPAGVFLTTYHNRLIIGGFFGEYDPDPDDDTIGMQSTAYVSFPGEPEAFDQVDGLIVAPLEGNPLTNAQEYRDTLYLFKNTRTYAYNDNGDVPSSWPLTIIDQGIGASVHGVGQVLDSGGVNIEYLLIIDYSGIMVFNGTYVRPELSWKIRDYWMNIARSDFKDIQIMNDSITQWIYVSLPNFLILLGDYSNELTPKAIKWALWKFPVKVRTITLINTNRLVIGSDGIFPADEEDEEVGGGS